MWTKILLIWKSWKYSWSVYNVFGLFYWLGNKTEQGRSMHNENRLDRYCMKLSYFRRSLTTDFFYSNQCASFSTECLILSPDGSVFDCPKPNPNLILTRSSPEAASLKTYMGRPLNLLTFSSNNFFSTFFDHLDRFVY